MGRRFVLYSTGILMQFEDEESAVLGRSLGFVLVEGTAWLGGA